MKELKNDYLKSFHINFIRENLYEADSLIRSKFGKNKDVYMMTREWYSKLLLIGKVKEYINLISPYYPERYKHYLRGAKTYRGFATLLRQISKGNDITFTGKIKRTTRSHETIYYVSFMNFQ